MLCKSPPYQFVKSKVVWDGAEGETAVECIFRERERRKTETESDSRLSVDIVRPESPVIV